MLKISNVINKTMGFKPYKIGNKTGWTKEEQLLNGSKNIYKHLPTGTVIKQRVNTNGETITKKILKHDGTEIRAYRLKDNTRTMIYLRRPDKTGIIAKTNEYFDYTKQKYIAAIFGDSHLKKHIFSPLQKLKIKLGIS